MAATKLKSHRLKQNNSGKVQSKADSAAQQQALLKFFNTKSLPLHLQRQQFHFDVAMPRAHKVLDLDGYVEEMQWQETQQQAWMQGNITLSNIGLHKQHYSVEHGDQVRCNVRWGGRWIDLWQMRVWDPDRTLQAGARTLQAVLYDDLHLLSLSQDDFHMTNVFCHQVLLQVAAAYKIPLGRVAMGSYKIKVFDHTKISPLDAIIMAYKEERQHSGRKFVLRWHNGKFEVTPLRRNKLLYVMHEQIVDATAHHVMPDDFATALTIRSSTSHRGSNRLQKRVQTVTRNADIWGYVHRPSNFGNLNERQLVAAAKQDLAKRQKPGQQIDFEHQGIALVRKGDAVQMLIPAEGYVGRDSIVWVSDITHTLQAGNYMMSPTLTASDPVLNAEEQLQNSNHKKRAKKRVQRRRGSKLEQELA